MRRKKTIPVGDFQVDVRELTLAEIRAWFADMANPQPEQDIADVLLFRDMSVRELLQTTDLTADKLADLTPSEIDSVIAAVREVNPHFFEMRARLAEVGQRAAGAAAPASPTSSGASAP